MGSFLPGAEDCTLSHHTSEVYVSAVAGSEGEQVPEREGRGERILW